MRRGAREKVEVTDRLNNENQMYTFRMEARHVKTLTAPPNPEKEQKGEESKIARGRKKKRCGE